jgi:hypothetical protein
MRTKIIAGGAIAVLLVGLGSYFLVHSRTEAAFLDEVDSRIANDETLLSRSIRLTARDLLGEVQEQADQPSMAAIFDALDENSRRDRGFAAADAAATWFGNPSRGHGGMPELVAVTDDHGRVVARNADRNRMYGTDLAHTLPAVARALGGVPSADVWENQDEHKVLVIAAAPFHDANGQPHVLLVGYDLSNGFAQNESEVLGREVAFVSAQGVYSSSLDASAQLDALSAFLAGDGAAAATAARDGGQTSDAWLATLGGTQYVGVIGPLGLPSGHVAIVVLADRSSQAAKAGVAMVILGFMLAGLLIVIAYGFVLGGSLLKPIEQMEEGVLAIINGRTDLRLQIESAEFGGLAYRINQLLNVFTGTPEADESGRVSNAPAAAWGGSDGGDAPSSAGGGAPAGAGAADDGEADPAVVAKLAAEPEDAYYTRVYNEYVAAKQAAGENVSNIPQDKFVQRLKANEKAQIAKSGARMVRFQVQVAGTQVNLKPVNIK